MQCFSSIVLLFCLWSVKYKIAITGNVAVGFITGKQASFCNCTALVVSFYCTFGEKQNWQAKLNFQHFFLLLQS